MGFTTTERADMDVLVFVRTRVSTVTSEVPADANDTVVGAEEVMVTVLGPCCLTVTFEFDGQSTVGVLHRIVASLSTDKAVRH